MNISWITLRDLEYLVAVADHMHFGRAAEACHVSQPALSAQIKKIEDFLNLPVFERTNRRVVISDAGQAIVQQARVVLEEARKIADLARGDAEPLAGALRLGAIATLGPYYLPYLLNPLRKQYPKLNLLLKEGLTDGLIGELRAGTLDAVLASPTFASDGLREIPLFFESFVLVSPKTHELSTKNPIRPSDLNPSEMLFLEDGHCLKNQALGLCPSGRRGRVREFHATSIETLRHLIATGHGYTLLPKLAAHEDPRFKNLLAYRRVDAKGAGRVIALYCREKYSRMRDIDALAAVIRKNMPEGVDLVR